MSVAFMATQTTVTVTDDLDGSANAKAVTFSLNGESSTNRPEPEEPGGAGEGVEAVHRKGHQTGAPSSCFVSEEGRSSGTPDGPCGGAELGQQQWIPGHRARSDQRRCAAGVRRRSLIHWWPEGAARRRWAPADQFIAECSTAARDEQTPPSTGWVRVPRPPGSALRVVRPSPNEAVHRSDVERAGTYCLKSVLDVGTAQVPKASLGFG